MKRDMRALVLVALCLCAGMDLRAQRLGFGLEMTGVFGRDGFFTSGLGVSTVLRVPGRDRALLLIGSAESGRKAFRNLLEADRSLFAWRTGMGYLLPFGDERHMLLAGPFLAYCMHHHRDTSDPGGELRWTRPYMQAGIHLSWTRLVGGDGRFGFELRCTPAVMGPVGDAEAVRTDVPPPARWVFPVGLGLSKGLGKRPATGTPTNQW